MINLYFFSPNNFDEKCLALHREGRLVLNFLKTELIAANGF